MVRRPLPTNIRKLREFLLHDDFFICLNTFHNIAVSDEEFIYFITHLTTTLSHQLEVRVCLLVLSLDKQMTLADFINDRPQTASVRLRPFFSIDLIFLLRIHNLDLSDKLLEFQQKTIRPSILRHQLTSLFPAVSILNEIKEPQIILNCLLDIIRLTESMIDLLEFNTETISDYTQLAHTLAFLLFKINYKNRNIIIEFIHTLQPELQVIFFSRMLKLFKPIISNQPLKNKNDTDLKHLRIQNHYRTLTLIFQNPIFSSLAFKHQTSSFFLFCNFKKNIESHPELFSI